MARMKPRARRIALLTVGAGLVAFNWSMLRDHLEAWWFRAIESWAERRPNTGDPSTWDYALQVLADETQMPVVYDPDLFDPDPDLPLVPPPEMLATLRATGYRIIEQRFPNRAYVVIGYPPLR
jgi:hypothetical protein